MLTFTGDNVSINWLFGWVSIDYLQEKGIIPEGYYENRI